MPDLGQWSVKQWPHPLLGWGGQDRRWPRAARERRRGLEAACQTPLSGLAGSGRNFYRDEERAGITAGNCTLDSPASLGGSGRTGLVSAGITSGCRLRAGPR
jgi:hypothetical protein